MESSCNILFPSFDPRTLSEKGKQSKLYGCDSWVQKSEGNFKMRQYANNINVKRRPVSSVRIRFDNHKKIRTFLTHIASCKRTHCWPTTPNIVGCHMLRPFARPVSCSCCWGPNLFICALVMFLNRVFRQERFNRFLWFLASLIKNSRTLRNCYLFSCRYKNVWDIGICLKPQFYKKSQ